MVQISFYIDEDAMRGSFVSVLRNAGLDVVTAAEAGRLGYSDVEQLDWATKQNRVLYSFNVKDFASLHNQLLVQGSSHAGIVVVPRQRYSIGEQLRGLLNLTNALSVEETVNQLLYLSNYLNQ
jgi:Domain of unknown function (DUF5615)